MDDKFRTDLPTPQKIRRVREASENKIQSTKNLKIWLFVGVTAIALIFTGLTSYSLIFKMTEHRGILLANIAAITGIALTDGMLLYWTLLAFRRADSNFQRITAGSMAVITVSAITIFGIGEQMMADGFIAPLQMRYIVTGFIVAQIVGVTIYELSSYETKLAMATYKTNLKTVQLLDKAAAEEADSFADVILAEAESRANFAYQIAAAVRQQSHQAQIEVPEELKEIEPKPKITGSNGRSNGKVKPEELPKVTRAA